MKKNLSFPVQHSSKYLSGRVLVEDGFNPSISVDNRQIAFERRVNGDNTQIWVYTISAPEENPVSDENANCYSPTFVTDVDYVWDIFYLCKSENETTLHHLNEVNRNIEWTFENH
jgi:hypothetical protein